MFNEQGKACTIASCMSTYYHAKLLMVVHKSSLLMLVMPVKMRQRDQSVYKDFTVSVQTRLLWPVACPLAGSSISP